HLKRFEYDPYQDDLAKIHDRFEFPTELDMSPWLHKDSRELLPDAPDGRADGGSIDEGCQADHGSSSYKLSAVVMHVGGPAAGHYYAYVRYKKPADSTVTWVKLDDHRVTKVSEAEVLRDAFGG
ncbi:unnamed protein product, partial [Scytosiphon promiscuus]